MIGRTVYNAGFASCWLFFVPCIYYFSRIVYTENLAMVWDYIAGMALGLVLNIAGILKLIDWMADKDTNYIFDQRNILPQDREHKTTGTSAMD